MGIVYFPLLYFIITAFIFIQLIPIYGEVNLPQKDIGKLFNDNLKFLTLAGETIHSAENPNQNLIINQQNNNVGFEVCTGSEPSFTCTYSKRRHINFSIYL